ncbi:hypothetical protein SD457_07045 [Coprobacillaceae bacterium CR2/5/TPMF4]|nr:hypothetical protein SD457_07045 [Coprobacillaceae bacterium CR2/5/TPMF4]
MIKLNYFSDFGNNQYLLDVVKIFNKIATKKQFKKAELEELGLSEYLLKKYSNKETAKLFKEVDTIGLVNELIKSIPKGIICSRTD